MAKHTRDELRQWQALPLSIKVRMSMERIRMWVREYGEEGVYVSFSGGKDSTVLSHLVDRTWPNNEIPRVFVNTGLEFPEIVSFVKQEPRAVLLKPEMNFRKVIEKYGYPFITKEVSQTVWEAKNLYEGNTRMDKLMGTGRYENSLYNHKRYAFFLEPDAPKISHQCCKVMKKNPAIKYEKETGRVCMTAEMAEESLLRTQNWLQHGCNMYDNKRPKSTPMAFWTEQDVLHYIKQNGIEIASPYGEIVPDESAEQLEGQLEFTDAGIEETTCPLKTTKAKRTGCMFCGFGCQREKEGEGRFERLKITHPKIYEWIFKDWESGGLGYKKVIDWINEHGGMNIKY